MGPKVAKPSMDQGGVVIPGFLACRKRINTMAQFLDHLADTVMPSLLDSKPAG
jgi:hypothetical protein